MSNLLNLMNSLVQISLNSDEKILYFFKVKYLGYEVYILYVLFVRDRMEWCIWIVEIKICYVKVLFLQNVEFFRLRVFVDVVFYYELILMYV